MTQEQLTKVASEARERAYAPYSNFKVGAALLARSGKVYSGCNVENASLGLTICAERAALATAIAGGDNEFVSVAVVTTFKSPLFPCGACRQVLAEFGLDMQVIASTTDGQTDTRTLADLLPEAEAKILGAG